MEVLAQTIRNGGPVMLVLLGIFGLGLATTLLLGILGGAKRKVPIVAWLAMPSLLLLIGLAATLQGMLMADKAIAFASPETAAIIASAGFSIALLTTIAGTVMAALLLVISAWMAAFGSVVRSGEGETVSRAPAVLGGGLLLLGSVGVLGGSALQGAPLSGLALVLLASGPAIALAGLRIHKTSASDQAENQLAAGLCSTGAVLLAAIAYALQGTIALHEAAAYAPLELRSTMMFAGVALQQQAISTGPVAVLIAMLGSAIASAAALRAVPKGRAMLSAALLGAVLLGAVTLVGGIQHVFTSFTTHWPAYALADIPTDGDELPRDETVSGAPGHAELVLEDIQVLLEKDGQWLDQAHGSTPATFPLPTDQHSSRPSPLLVVSADRPAVVISQTQWDIDPIDLQVLVHSEVSPQAQDNPWLKIASTRALRLSWLPEQPLPTEPTDEPKSEGLLSFSFSQMPAIEQLLLDEGVLFIIDKNDENLLWQPSSRYSAHISPAETVSTLQAQLDSAAVERLVFVPGLSWSVQDLVSMCTSTVAHSAEPLDCMLLPALQLFELDSMSE